MIYNLLKEIIFGRLTQPLVRAVCAQLDCAESVAVPNYIGCPFRLVAVVVACERASRALCPSLAVGGR